MVDDFIKIEVQGIEKIQAALAKFPKEIGKALQGAGKDAATNVIFPTEGLKKYPPLTAANAPPEPYYIRGKGTMYKSGLKATSERLGTQFYAKKASSFSTEIGNRASYAKYVVGDDQAWMHTPHGWRVLSMVVKEKLGNIVKVYQAWVDKLLRDLSL